MKCLESLYYIVGIFHKEIRNLKREIENDILDALEWEHLEKRSW